MRRIALALAAALSALPASAGARSGAVATLGGSVAGMSAWNGHVVFSQLDPATGRWSLMQAGGTRVSRLAVAPRRTPFDADVGTDGAGRPAAVFSRCPAASARRSGGTISGTSGCRIYVLRLDLADAGPRLVRSLVARGFSDGAPAIWRGRVAFGRVVDGGTMAAIFVQRRAGSRRLVRLARGTIPTCPRAERRCYRTAAPSSMDLGPARVAFVWTLAGGNGYPQEDEELRAAPLDGSPGRLLDVGGAGECGFGGPYSFRRFGHPLAWRGRVSYLAARGDCRLTDSTFTMSGPGARTRYERSSRSGGAPRTFAYAAARDGTGWWWVRGPRATPNQDGSLGDPCNQGRCRLVHSPRLALHRVHVRRPPRPPVRPTDG